MELNAIIANKCFNSESLFFNHIFNILWISYSNSSVYEIKTESHSVSLHFAMTLNENGMCV